MKATIGTVSSATMRTEDLYDAFTSELERLDSKRYLQFVLDKSEDPDEQIEELFDILNQYAPDGCYFGAHPGDGCDYGFWKFEECEDLE